MEPSRGPDAGVNRPRIALLGVVALALGAVLVVGNVLDRPLWSRHRAGGARAAGRAAVALRDHVPEYQKLGTELFARPVLAAGYDEVRFFTASARDDRRREFVIALEDLLRRYEVVDVFLLAHGNWVVDWVFAIDPALRRRIRLVYNTGCRGARQARYWLDAGARAYVGHPAKKSVSPLFVFFFLRRWERGWELRDAVADANARAGRRASWLGLSEVRRPTAELFGPGDLRIDGR